MPRFYMSTDFGDDSSSRFPLKVQTNKQMWLNALRHTGGYIAGMGNNNKPWEIRWKITVIKHHVPCMSISKHSRQTLLGW